MYIPTNPASLTDQLPKGLQSMLRKAQGTTDTEATSGVPRRSFLKLASASGFSLGIFPVLAQAQSAASPTATSAAASSLKPTQQPSAFVSIARDGAVMVTINRLDFGQGVQTGLPMILAE